MKRLIVLMLLGLISLFQTQARPRITKFALKSGNFVKLKLKGCEKLQILNCANNQLDSLDVSGCVTLGVLYCENNQLRNLNVSGCTSLTELYCSNNQLTSLNVRGCTAMKSLECNNNRLRSMDVSENTNLKGLGCSSNRLTSLNVSHNKNLYELACSSNRLKSLDLRGNEQCQIVACEDNHISLSHIYPLMARRTTETNHLFSPQSDTMSLERGAVFDLSKEMQFGSSATKWSVLNPDSTAVASGTFEENNGQFRFLKKGDYRLVLQNDSVRQQYQQGDGTVDSSAVVFSWVVKVFTHDTILMKVRGTSAEFSFTANKNAMYYVDWDDGSEERRACTAGEEKTLPHTYTDSNTYDITFFVYEAPEPTDYTEPFPGIDMVWVKGGTFQMGKPAWESRGWVDETPMHEVTLSGYFIGKYEITQAQWKAVMGTTIEQQRDKKSTKETLIGVGDNYPMYYVSWNEAKAFCDTLSKKTGKKYALPTEAQWEFAARGGVKSKDYEYSGSDTLAKVAWYKEEYDYNKNDGSWITGNSEGKTHAVGTRAPNELGIYDMSGNVFEVCADYWVFGPYSSGAASVTNPTGPSSGTQYVFRGGSWYSGQHSCRVRARNNSTGPDNRSNTKGFRIVCLP